MSMLGTSGSSSPSLVRMFLRADSAEMLVRLQLQTNVLLLGRADYTDIQQADDGKWYAWFLVDVAKYPQFLKGINGAVSNTRRSRAS